ncbi:flavin reductase family protein [Streptomyces fildesensis]|uniref:Flavin reductase family protein n=1 Tax=Streptomyces fildesensis TaxID=375757 RepID=A0ABW8CHY9_9ACTN
MDGFTDLLDYPMYVVTAAAGGERSGCLVGFASQCSLEPVRFVVWLSKANHTRPVAERAAFLGVHVLGRDQLGLAELFGGETGDRVDKFDGVDWSPGRDGVPVLADARAWFVGRIEDRADWGDHVGFLLSPVDGDAMTMPRGALLRLSDVLDVTPGHPS